MRVGRANGDDWLRLGDAAAELGVSLNTLRRWSDAGALTCYRSPGGHRRYRRTDIEALLRTEAGADLSRRPISPTSAARAVEEMREPLLTLARVAAEGAGVTQCRVSIGNGDAGFVLFTAGSRIDSDLPIHEMTAPKPPLPPVREVLRSGRRLVIADLATTSLLERGDADLLRRHGDSALLAVPVKLSGRERAVLELVETRSPRAFSGANVAFAEFMARQIARLLSADERDDAGSEPPALAEKTLDEMATGKPGANDVLTTLADRLRRELRAVACDVLRYDRQADTLEPVAVSSAGEDPPLCGLVHSPAELGAVAESLASGESAAIPDLAVVTVGGPHLVRREHNGARGLHVTPIRQGHDVVGLLEVYTTERARMLGREELVLLEAGAATAALVLSGRRDPALLARRVAHLDDLIAGSGLHPPALDAESLVLSTLRAIRSRPAFRACTVYRVDEETATPFPPTDLGGNPLDDGSSWRLTDCPAATRVLAARAPAGMTLEDAGDPGVAERFLSRRGLIGVIYAPVLFWDRLVGILEFGSDTIDGLATAAQVAPVAADLLGVALGSGEVITRLQRRNRDLALVVEAGLEDTARLSTDGILRAVVERLSELTRTPVADVYTVDGDTLRALASYDGGRFDAEWSGVTLPLSRYPTSRKAVDTGELVVAASLDDPVLGDDGRYSLEKWGYQAQLSVPLVVHGRVLGLVELCDYQPRDFTDDLDLVRGLCQVAAHALENASLFEQVERRNRILNELVELATLASGTRDVSELTRVVAERVLSTVDAANCDVYRLEAGALVCAASFDRSGHDASVLGSVFDLERYPTTKAALQSHRILTITSPDDPQLSEGERRTYHDYGFSSEVCLPLVVGHELFGLLDLYDTRERDFSEYMTFLRSVAQTLAGAFDNARLLEQLDQRGVALRDIVELGAVASQAHDLETVLATLAQRLRDTIGAADCDIFTLHDDRLRCMVSADTGGLDASVVGKVLDVDRFPATALAIRTGQVMTVENLDDPRLTDEERADMAEYGFQSELCIPLVGGDRVIGLIDVFDTRPRDFGEYLDLLRSVGQTAAGAIENARLLEKLEHRNTALAELVELGRAASSAGGLNELVRAIGPRVVELMEADGCQVFVLRGDTLHCVLTYDDGQFLDDYADKPLDLDLFPSTRVAIAERSALVIQSPDDPRLSNYERSLYLESGSQSEICVPLLLEDRVVGLLDVYDHRRRDYEEHRDFLLRVGQMMAGAFENALLMERLEDSNQTLGLLVESGIEFGATLDQDEVLQSVARRLCAATSAPNCDIFILHGELIRCAACIDHGEPDPEYVGAEYPLAQLGLARLAVESRRPVYAEDITTDERVSRLEREEDVSWGHRSMLCLPLISRGQVMGLASIYDDHARRFERTDLLHSLAQVAAGALTNAMLFDELDRSAERMTLVGDVSFELSSSLDLDVVLLSTAKRLCAVAGAPMCDIYILRDGSTLENVTSIDDGSVDAEWQGRRFPLEEWGAMRLAAESLDPVIIAGRDDPRLSPEEVALMERFSEMGALIVPLISRERVIGLLELTHHDRHEYLAEEISTIVSICRFAALAIDNAELYEGIKGMHLSNLKALSSALNAKDYYTLGHAARVAAYMVLLGKELDWPEDLLRDVEEAAYLHDIGKIGVPDRVLLKPSGLNGHEWELMRQHPIFSAEIIRPLFDDALVEGVRHHHERWGGDGYPDGLAGEDIPLIARAMCVVDSYDAMSFRRPYRQGLTAEECLDELERCSGDQFDPAMVAAFRRVLETIAEGRRIAAGIAGRAAAALTADACVALREHRDERLPEYAAVTAELRKALAAIPGARYVTAFAREGRTTIVLADSGGGSTESPRPGDEVVADEELLEVFAGRTLPANVLLVDQLGVWISGVAPVVDEDGTVVAAVAAAIPATEGATEVEGLHSNVAQTFASMLHTTAVQSGRSELEAITDGLTGLYNHRYFHERLSYEIDRCQQENTSLALLFCDLDNFRAFNELHGHAVGDKALRAVARVMESSVRHVDLVARYGGEEFAAILLDTEETGALDVAERIRAGITRTVVTGREAISVSIGVATCPMDATFKDELVDKADWAMYLAKRRGRDKVMTFGAQHGGETPEQAAVVRPEHVAVMGELVAARESFRQRRRSAIVQIALGVARQSGVEADDIQAAVAALENGEGAPDTPAGSIVALAETYRTLVTDRPYRARISEAEALDELLTCPALRGREELARAFEQVLAR
jgi:diguanylate cyclase (GGDEF)-like protein/excisionase family DNA binding protein